MPIVGPVRRPGPRPTGPRSCRPACPTLSVEAGATFGWARWADASVGIDRFGASAPGRRRDWSKLGFDRRQRGRRAARALLRRPIARRSAHRDDDSTTLHARAGPEPLARQPPARLDRAPASCRRWVDRGVRGITSNPTIFQKAIAGSDDYDEQFGALVAGGHVGRGRYWAMVIDDISEAARASCGRSTTQRGGVDGFVSVEVAPPGPRHRRAPSPRPATARAHRPAQPVREDPGTAEGVPAIQR